MLQVNCSWIACMASSLNEGTRRMLGDWSLLLVQLVWSQALFLPLPLIVDPLREWVPAVNSHAYSAGLPWSSPRIHFCALVSLVSASSIPAPGWLVKKLTTHLFYSSSVIFFSLCPAPSVSSFPKASYLPWIPPILLVYSLPRHSKKFCRTGFVAVNTVWIDLLQSKLNYINQLVK